LAWLALLALLALTVTFAYQPLGSFNGPLSLVIAATKALVVGVVFMELRPQRPLMIAAAAAGLCWLAILLWLASADFSRRTLVPAPVGTQDRVWQSGDNAFGHKVQ
jgi:cytochrome c oxidase subunit 4